MTRRYYRGYRRYDYGHQRAIQHIQEARELSRTVGGTDQDVKKYFFSLSTDKLGVVLDEYQAEYGSRARSYAERTIPNWRSGAVHMSGLVAERLYGLLPRHMPLSEKYELVESLWEKFRPQSQKQLRVGPDCTDSNVMHALFQHLDAMVKSYNVPDPLKLRFEWLADGDVRVYQDLLNHFLQRDKQIALRAVQDRLPVFFGQIRNRGEITHHLSQEICVGGHLLNICFDPQSQGLRWEEMGWTRPSPQGLIEQWGCLIAIGILCLVWLLSQMF